MRKPWGRRSVLAAGLALAGAAGAFEIPFIFLEGPSQRDNKFDPKNPNRTPTAVPFPTFPAAATASFTLSPTRSATPTASPSETAYAGTPTHTPTSSVTPPPGSTASSTPSPSPSPSPSPTASASPSTSATPTASPSASATPAAGGNWPMLSNFNAGVNANSAGGVVDFGNDNQEGGSSTSASSILSSSASPQDGTPYLNWSYNVGTNAGLGYQYAYASYSLVSPSDISATNAVRFWARASSAVTVRVQLQANANDACIPAVKNKMYFDVAVTTSWTQISLPFNTFTDRYAGCPFISGGWLAAIGDISFSISSLGSGTVDLDDLEFASVALATATPTPNNGAWPMLSNFNGDVVNDNAGGNLDVGNDNNEGGSSTSTSAVVQGSNPPTPPFPYLHWTYNVGTNAGLGYEYAYFAYSLVSPRDLSAYNAVRFWCQASPAAPIRVQLQGAALDACIPGAKNKMYTDFMPAPTWMQVTLPFNVFTDRYAGCPYVAGGWPANTESVSFSISSLGGGTVDVDDLEFIYIPPPDNGAWPALSTFNANITANNAGGGGGTPNAAYNDTQDGCGVSSPPGSTASLSQQSVAGVDGTAFLRMSYNVVANASCGYEYAAVAFPFLTQDLTGKTSIDFAIKSTDTVRIVLKTKNQDLCLGPGVKNKMWIDIPSTGGSWQALNRAFTAFTLSNAGCPFPLNDVDDLSFVVSNPGASGDLDLDNLSFP